MGRDKHTAKEILWRLDSIGGSHFICNMETTSFLYSESWPDWERPKRYGGGHDMGVVRDFHVVWSWGRNLLFILYYKKVADRWTAV